MTDSRRQRSLAVPRGRYATDPGATGNLAHGSVAFGMADEGRSARRGSNARRSRASERGGRRADARPSSRTRTSGRASASESRHAARRTDARADRGAERPRGRTRAGERHRTNFMRYATDNRIIQTLYAVLTGPYRVVIYIAVIVAVGLGLYFPVRDLYIAYRSGDILERQLEIYEKYNEGLQGDVDKLLSVEGIEETARDLGLVMPGEQAIDVMGLDDASSTDGDTTADDTSGADASSTDTSGSTDGSSTSDASTDDTATSEPSTSAEVEAAARAVAEDAPWYIKLLDGIFFFPGVDGQKIASTGE